MSEGSSENSIKAVISSVLDIDQQRTRYAYGTAGFRGKYDYSMHLLFVQIGIIAALRSMSLNGQCVGVMVTASHNEECDNGVKIVDFDGGMLEKSWEAKAEALVNEEVDQFVQSVSELLSLSPKPLTSTIMIAMDTRTHSPLLVDYVCQGIRAVAGTSCRINLLGEAITPVLHFSVKSFNDKNNHQASISNSSFDSKVAISQYFQTLFSGYRSILNTKSSASNSSTSTRKLILDTAFGVGSITTSQFLEYLTSTEQSLLPWSIEIKNAAGEGPVNHDCGAEHAQKLRLPPTGFSPSSYDASSLFCSFDGDGDRIVFHYFDTNQQWILLDGDRIAALVAVFIYQTLRDAGLLSSITMGIVQTAYANGSSTAFLRGLNVPIYVAKTGVKYLHHKAQELDVGVYFEANGHGTVLFSQKFQAILGAADPSLTDDVVMINAITRLKACLELINPTVGDALSDLLCVFAILELQEMDAVAWNGMYKELPSRQVKLAVRDKNALICSEDETYLIAPTALQEAVNLAAKKVTNGRCFVRPSGTEDVVRIYVEAESEGEVEQVISEVKAAIQSLGI